MIVVMVVLLGYLSRTARNLWLVTIQMTKDHPLDAPSIHPFVTWNAKTSSASTTTNVSDCYRRLEVRKNRWIDEWLEADVPLLDAVLQVSDHVYQISLITKHLNVHQKSYWNYNITWYCNSIDNPGRLLVQNTPVHLVECTVPAGNLPLRRLWPSKPSIKTNQTQYYAESCLMAYVECDGLELKETPSHLLRPFHATTQPKQLGACIIERMVDVSQLAEWIGYHRLMGVDHFWVYQNDDSQRPLPDWSDVTYLPYNFVWGDHANRSTLYRKPPRKIFWQEAMQLRCLYHAKRLGLEWITTTDVDEYIWVNVTDYHDQEYPLKRYLLDHYEELKSFSGLTMNSVFFGRHPKDEPTTPNVSQPFIDYVWRTASSKWQRYKQIYQVPNVDSPEVHTSRGNGGDYKLKEIYLQHYKTPWKGVYKSTRQILVKDTRLRDLYRDRVVAAVTSGTGK
jgi:hypothetical protein